mmetsp:Transcript_33793/g.106262  ORF Transcript_33793/g.106262 Transcript_33793/m.106262 type:complete len:356 (-) Transcript_33793:22-1089(-)
MKASPSAASCCGLSASPCSSATLLSAAARSSSMSCAMSGRSSRSARNAPPRLASPPDSCERGIASASSGSIARRAASIGGIVGQHVSSRSKVMHATDAPPPPARPPPRAGQARGCRSHPPHRSGWLARTDSTKRASCARVSATPLERPVSTTKSARVRLSASGSCLARIVSSLASLIPGRARQRRRCSAALQETRRTTSTSARRAASSRSVSRRRGTSTTTSHSPSSPARRTNPARSSVTSGCTISSSRCSDASRPAVATAAERAARSMPPSAPRALGKAAHTGSTAAPPAAYSECTVASASCTRKPHLRNHAAAELLPMPMPPVRPTTVAVLLRAGMRAPTPAAAMAASPAISL